MSPVTPPLSAPRTAVATVSYGSADVLPDFLDSIPSASKMPLIVVVVDNLPAGDADVAALASEYGATYLPMQHNLGYGGALNAAVASLPQSIEWILLSNPDVVLSDGVVDSLVAAGDRDERIAAVGP